MSLNITESSPDTMGFLMEVAKNSEDLYKYDKIKLWTTSVQGDAAERIGQIVKIVLNSRTYFRVSRLHGSFQRGTSLVKQGVSDVDVLCFIKEDYNRNRLGSFGDFERIRSNASNVIRVYLERQLPTWFFSVETDEFWDGLCLKLRVKQYRSSNPEWRVEVIFAFDAPAYPDPDICRLYDELAVLPRRVQERGANCFSILRNEFIMRTFEMERNLIVLVRLLKCFKWISKEQMGLNKGVSSFVMEMLVVLLYVNNTIPPSFSLRRAFFTCLDYIGSSGSRVVCIRDWDSSRWDWSEYGFRAVPFQPTIQQLDSMKERSAGDLVIADPFSPSNNIAARNQSTSVAWDFLKRDAQIMVSLLGRSGITSYSTVQWY